MKTRNLILIMAFLLAVPASGPAQFIATWSGGGGDTDWNNALNWDTLEVPGVGTNAVISAAVTVNYNAPMAAPSFSTLSCVGVLNINAAGFTVDGAGDGVIGFSGSASRLAINAGGAVSLTAGGLTLSNAAGLSLASGGSLTVAGNLLLGRNGTGNTGFATNDGGFISAAATSVNPNNNSSTSRLVINGGTNNLGNVVVKRSGAGSGGFSALGSEGLIISNGIVNMTSLDLGGTDGNSFLTMFLANGAVTNTGDMIVRQVSGGRSSRFLQTGGWFVCSGANGVNLRGHPANNSIAIYAVLGGTNLVQGFILGNPDGTDATGTIRLTNAAKIYLGGGGITSVGTLNTKTIALNNGGVFGAQADWSGTEPILLAGGAFDAASLDGTPHAITLSGVLSGPGALIKNGGGTLTLEASNTYSGNTLINQGTLALGASGSIATTPQIIVAEGASFDVSAVAGFTLGATRTLGGSGTVAGDVAVASGGILNPGTSPGTLTLNGSLTETGGAVNHFDLPAAPGPGNDLLVVNGDLNLSGVNTVEIVGGGAPGSVHTLIQYSGNFNGTLDNLALSGVNGVLSNNVSAKTIALIIQSAIRSPTDVVWVGNAVANDWDTVNRTNWLNTGTGLLDYFVAGDNARFDDTGAAHPNVNLVGNNAPASVVVDATANYMFTGGGAISGAASLTKTNTGTLTINATNAYTGVTTIAGGVLEVPSLSPAGFNSPIGAASASSANLVFEGGTLRYTGAGTSTDRGATFKAGGAALEVATGGATLTLGGALTGPGALTKSGPGTLSLSSPNDYAGGTLIEQGTLRINASGVAGSGAITNKNSTLLVGSAISFGNVLHFTGTCTVDLNNAGGNTALNGAWSGEGTVDIINQQNSTRTFTIGGNGTGGYLWDFSGTINMGTNDGTLRFNDGGGSFNLGSSNAVFNLGSGTAILRGRNGGVTVHLGALLGGPATRLLGRSSDGGDITYSVGGKNTDFTFEGAIEDTSPTVRTAIIKTGAGKWTLTGISSYTGNTTIGEGVLQVDGALGNTSVSVTGGTLAGSGTIAGAVDVQYGGTLSPGGASIGQLTINNWLTLQSGSTTVMELDKGLGLNDSIAGLAAVSYGGKLIVTNLSGTLQAGDTFYLFPAAALYAGAVFEELTLPDLASGLEWDLSQLNVDGSIRVTAGAMLNYARVGNNLELSWTGLFKLQAQTNSLGTGLSNNWFDYPDGGSPPVIVPIDPASPAVFFRLEQLPQ
jgi:autotransporter-associated beta strand protein